MSQPAQFPDGWRSVTLPEIIGDDGVFIDGDWVESKDQDPDGDVRLIQLADIGEGEFIDKSARFLTAAKAKELKCTDLEPGDVLIARMPDPLGRACMFPGLDQRCVTVVDVCIVRPDPRLVDARCLCRLINADGFRRELDKYIVGTTRQRISRGNLAKIQFPLPPLAEQKRIAAVLDKADDLRGKRRQTLATLDTLLQSVYLDMFGDPVTNPKGWPRITFEEVAPSRLGKMLDSKQQTGEHGRPYLRNISVQWDRFDLSDVQSMDFDVDDREEFLLKSGDLMICEGGEPGRCAIWREELPECYFQKALHRARPYPTKATAEFLLYLMWALADCGGFKDHVTVATIAHLTGEKLKRMLVPVPPVALQRKFATIYAKVRARRTVIASAAVTADTLFAALQSAAFAGTLFNGQRATPAASPSARPTARPVPV